jgi:hypothetical protein
VILGDNANIFRLLNAEGEFLSFVHDDYATPLRLIPRAAELRDYTPGGLDFNPDAADDIGAHDELHGGPGDDSIYGMVGDDVLFGEGQDDDLVGGSGSDWISGGTGQDGVLGDDGRIYTSRNALGAAGAEPLYGVAGFTAEELNLEISTAGDFQLATINVAGELKKTVNLTPFNLDPNINAQDSLFDPQHADDIIYGGLGDDFLHGGAGDDAISGAEALALSAAMVYPDDGTTDAARTDGVLLSFGYDKPLVVERAEAALAAADPAFAIGFRLLGFDALKGGEFSHYDEFDAWRRILVDGQEYFLNFDAKDPGALLVDGSNPANPIFSDGADRIFGDLGNDWVVGGTGRDRMYGGYGNDLLNADDDLTTLDGTNQAPDGPQHFYEDIAYGGAGRDVLIANTGGDRLIDWVGEFDSYIVPFAPFGPGTVSRQPLPGLFDYLYDLSESDGADRTRASAAGNPERNGEPHGELGLVTQKDLDWQSQTGAPDDPQPGNIPGGPRDLLRAADFNMGVSEGFAADSGTWAVSAGRLEVAPETLGADAVSVFYVDEWIPKYFEITATINAAKPVAGYKANTYLIFDYHSSTDFKYAGVNISTDKLEMGYRDATGWHELEQANARLRPDRDYRLLLSVSGNTATLVVDGTELFVHEFAGRVDEDGFLYALNAGMVGVGTNNAKGRLDDVAVQVLPPEITHEELEPFDGATGGIYLPLSGDWQVLDGSYRATGGAPAAIAAFSYDVAPPSVVQLEADVATDDLAGIVFDYYNAEDFKFAAIDALNDRVVIGHRHDGAWVIDVEADATIQAGVSYRLEAELLGARSTLRLNGVTVLNHAFNALVNDGDAGLLSRGASSFDDAAWRTDDPAFLEEEAPAALMAASTALEPVAAQSALTQAELAPILDEAIRRWSEAILPAGGTLELLNSLTVQIADLDGRTLGLASDDRLWIDSTAAGHGWFIDPTPRDDVEFRARAVDGALRATPASSAAGSMDLLSVVTHELGHVLGRDSHELFGTVLDTGLRVAHSAPAAPPAPSGSNDHATQIEYAIRVLAAAAWLDDEDDREDDYSISEIAFD